MVDLSSNPYGVGRAVSASGVSLRSLVVTLRRRRGVFFGVLAFALAACLAYCLFAPKQFEASARVALRSAPDTALNLDGSQAPRPSSGAMGQAELETMAAVLHSDKLAWRVIRDLRLYSAPAFAADFPVRFRAFDIDNPDPTAQSWLLERFARNLHTGTVPRTLVVEVRFRSHDPALSAAIVNGLIRAYDEQAAILKKIGAKYIINSSSPNFIEELTRALAETKATIAFDAIRGGRLASQILSSMEAAANLDAKTYSRYGSDVRKQVYAYGRLNTAMMELGADFGFAWSVSGWLLTPFLQNIGPADTQRPGCTPVAPVA